MAFEPARPGSPLPDAEENPDDFVLPDFYWVLRPVNPAHVPDDSKSGKWRLTCKTATGSVVKAVMGASGLTPVVFSPVQSVTSPLLGGAVRSRRCTWNAAVLHFRPPDAQSFAPLFQGLVWFNVSGKGPLLFSTCGRGLQESAEDFEPFHLLAVACVAVLRMRGVVHGECSRCELPCRCRVAPVLRVVLD